MLRLRTAVIVCLLVCCSAGATTAQELLSHVPDRAFGFLVVNRLDEASGKIEELARQFELPIPSPLLFLKQAGISEGFDMKGSVMFLAMPPDPAVKQGDENAKDETEAFDTFKVFEGMFPVAFLPVTDYGDFVKQFGAQDPDDTIIEVPVAGAPLLIGRKGKYAVLAEPEHRVTLEKIVSSKDPGAAALVRLEKWLAAQDVVVGITPFGTQQMTAQALGALKATRDFYKNLLNDLGPEQRGILDQMNANLAVYEDIVRLIQQEVPAGAAGLRIGDGKDLFLATQFVFKAGGRLANWSTAKRVPDAKLLAGVPAEPFVAVAGTTLSPELGTALGGWVGELSRFNTLTPGMQPLDEKTSAELTKVTKSLLAQMRSSTFGFGPGEGDAPLFSGFHSFIRVNDAAGYLKEYARTFDVLNRAFTEKDSPWKVEVRQVAGAPGLVVTMDFFAAVDEQLLPFVQDMYKRMFGEEGTLSIYLTTIDKQTLAMSYDSEARLQQLVEGHRKRAQAFAQQADIQASTKLLPGEWDSVAFFSPQGMVQLVRRAAEMWDAAEVVEAIEDFPATPPVFAAARTNLVGAETQLVIPAQTFTASVNYIRELIASAREGLR